MTLRALARSKVVATPAPAPTKTWASAVTLTRSPPCLPALHRRKPRARKLRELGKRRGQDLQRRRAIAIERDATARRPERRQESLVEISLRQRRQALEGRRVYQ